jgi:hypothetical protein
MRYTQKRRTTTSKEIGLSKPILQRLATRGNRCRRIVALEEVAGSSPVGHPFICREKLAKCSALALSPGLLTVFIYESKSPNLLIASFWTSTPWPKTSVPLAPLD